MRTRCGFVVYGLTMAALCLAPSAGGDALLKGYPGEGGVEAPPEAWGFELREVRLEDGVFKGAMERNEEWLLDLDPDRFLARFREEAGLEPKAEAYGGWERDSIAGHSLGHHLSACAMQYAATGDERFKERVDYIVSELAVCQAEHGDGYVAAIPEGRRVFEEVSQGDIRSAGFDLNGAWVPWYNIDKTFAGLRDACWHAGNEQALEVAKEFAEWAHETTKDLTHNEWQEMLACEFGGMKHSLADLHTITGDPMHLELAEKFHHEAVLDPLADRQDELAGLHANTQIPKINGAARLYELTGREEYHTIAEFFWERVVHHHSYVNGGHSSYEMFGPPGELAQRLGDTTETCNTYNMLKLTGHLFSWEPRGELMDYYERALLNHILASQHPETGMVKYKGYLEMPARKGFSHPTDSWWCCCGTGMENHTKYGEDIYFHTGDSLYVNLFIASTLDWADKGVTVHQTTAFPEEEGTRLEFSCEESVELSLWVRNPAWWGDDFRVRVNGEHWDAADTRDGYVEISRAFEDGDVVEIETPMDFRIESMPDDPNRIAFFYGPVLLSAVLSESENEDLPLVLGSNEALLDAFEPVEDEPLHFQAEDVGRMLEDGESETVSLDFRPHYEIGDELYTVYLDRVTEEEWDERRAGHEAEQERLRELEARTVSVMRVGEMQPERDHNLDGENTTAGEHAGRTWRHATDGGWFAFDMEVDPEEPQALQVTYWGSDSDGRAFDILIDDEVIATQHLDSPDPGNWVDKVYPIRPELTQGLESVRVRFQALPGHIAGGVFECRVIHFDPSETEPENPIFQGADPDSLLGDDTLWVYPTYRNGTERRFFAYSSRDLVNWYLHGPILDFADIDWIPDDKEAWAPGIVEKDGKYYFYYSVGPKPSHIGVAAADSPWGPFEDSGEPLLSDEGDPEFEAIDAMVFTDPHSGDSYLYAGGSAGATLRVFELGEDMMSFARELEVETPPNFTEGAFVHYRDGLYYLSYSHGNWWDGSYEIHYVTAETPHGPWDYHGAFAVSDENHRGPGHHSIVHNAAAGEWYLVYHRWNDKQEPGPYDDYRKTAIDLLEYDDEGLIKPVAMTDTGPGPVELGEASE
ncbi:MAG: beta-L-arabinofuranosidase domain-containing protein [Candidatus Hydrogenedentota bacterium]